MEESADLGLNKRRAAALSAEKRDKEHRLHEKSGVCQRGHLCSGNVCMRAVLTVDLLHLRCLHINVCESLCLCACVRVRVPVPVCSCMCRSPPETTGPRHLRSDPSRVHCARGPVQHTVASVTVPHDEQHQSINQSPEDGSPRCLPSSSMDHRCRGHGVMDGIRTQHHELSRVHHPKAQACPRTFREDP